MNMKPKQRQTLKEILALWGGGLITLPVAIRRIGGVFVTTEDGFTDKERHRRELGQAQRDAGITGLEISSGRSLGGCTSPVSGGGCTSPLVAA